MLVRSLLFVKYHLARIAVGVLLPSKITAARVKAQSYFEVSMTSRMNN